MSLRRSSSSIRSGGSPPGTFGGGRKQEMLHRSKHQARVAAEMAVLAIVHFAVGLGVATGINWLHRLAWPLPRTQEEVDRDRYWYAAHLTVFVPLIAVAYVLVLLGLQSVYRKALHVSPEAQTASTVLAGAGVILGFIWGSSVSQQKTSYLLGDSYLNPIAK